MTQDASPDRPLVTFALFAYNQEQYIREAVEGAFSQTYEPLEIILSDDCSTDRTFEIMQEMAAAYEGPHEVRVRRNGVNVGLIDHINTVTRISSGEMIVFAAGDDKSAPSRVARMNMAFEAKPNCKAVFCDVSETRNYKLKADKYIKIQRIHPTEIFMNAGGAGRGAGYAYKREVLICEGGIPASVKSEDKFLPAVASVIGEVYMVHEKLLFYRRHEQSLTAKLQAEANYAHQRPEHWGILVDVIRYGRSNKMLTLRDTLILLFCLYSARPVKVNAGNILHKIKILPARGVRRIFRQHPQIFALTALSAKPE